MSVLETIGLTFQDSSKSMLRGGDGVTPNVWPPDFSDFTSDTHVYVGQFTLGGGDSLLGCGVVRGFFDLTGLPTGTFIAVRIYGSATGKGINGYSGVIYGDWDTPDATDSGDMLPLGGPGDVFTADTGTTGGSGGSDNTVDYSFDLDPLDFTNALYALRVTPTDDYPSYGTDGDPGDLPQGMFVDFSVSLDVTYDDIDEGGGGDPVPPPPTMTPPTPPSGVPGGSGGNAGRTPPSLALQNLGSRNSPDIRYSGKLRVSGGSRITSEGGD